MHFEYFKAPNGLHNSQYLASVLTSDPVNINLYNDVDQLIVAKNQFESCLVTRTRVSRTFQSCVLHGLQRTGNLVVRRQESGIPYTVGQYNKNLDFTYDSSRGRQFLHSGMVL